MLQDSIKRKSLKQRWWFKSGADEACNADTFTLRTNAIIQPHANFYCVLTCFKKSYNKHRMIKSCDAVNGVVLFAEKVHIEARLSMIQPSGLYARLHGKDIHDIHLIGYGSNSNKQ